jgi:hypothetical protein
MNKMIRAAVALVSFALSSALFAISEDVYIDSGQTFDVTVNGSRDVEITIVNLATNQVVATINALVLGSGYSTNYLYYGSTASGVTLTTNTPYNAYVTGLPAGYYRITATSWGLSDFGSYNGGNWIEMDLYDPYGSDWVDINSYIY